MTSVPITEETVVPLPLITDDLKRLRIIFVNVSGAAHPADSPTGISAWNYSLARS